MKRFFLVILFVMPILVFGQNDTLSFVPNKIGRSYLSDVLINKKSNIGVFRIHYSNGRLSNSFYYVIDVKQKKILSTFSYKNWTYLYSSWIDDNEFLHLSKNSWIFSKEVIVDLNSGVELQSKKSQSKKQSEDDNNNLFIDSQDLYCTSGIVYWNNLKIFYDSKISGFILSNEN